MGLLRSNNFPSMTQKLLPTVSFIGPGPAHGISVLPRILYTDTSKFSSIIFSIIFFIIFVHQPSTLSISIVLSSIETDGVLNFFFLLFRRNRNPSFCLSQMTAQNESLF